MHAADRGAVSMRMTQPGLPLHHAAARAVPMRMTQPGLPLDHAAARAVPMRMTQPGAPIDHAAAAQQALNAHIQPHMGCAVPGQVLAQLVANPNWSREVTSSGQQLGQFTPAKTQTNVVDMTASRRYI